MRSLWNGGASRTVNPEATPSPQRAQLQHVTSVDAQAAAGQTEGGSPTLEAAHRIVPGQLIPPEGVDASAPSARDDSPPAPGRPRPPALAHRPHKLGVPFFSNADHREIVSAGAAAGLAAAFGAPIGGVLFSLEEACSHWSRNIGWRCFLAATAASFTLSQLHPRGRSGILGFGDISAPDNRQWLLQLPFIVAVSVLGGLLGAAFNAARGALASSRLRARRDNTPARLLESAAVACVTTLAMFGASLRFGACLPVPEVWDAELVIQFNCPAGQYNDMATLLLGTSVSVIRHLLGLGSEAQPVAPACGLLRPCYFSLRTLGVGTGLYLLLMVLAASTASPGGLFMPSIMVGAQFGALAGLALHALLPPSFGIKPGIFAIVCATATLAGVFRSSISLVVIVVEGTHGIDFMFGIIVAVVASNAINQLLHRDGVYEGDLERDGTVFYLRQEPPHALRYKTAADVMASPPVGLNAVASVPRVLELLRRTTHSAFVVYDDSSGRDPALGRGRLAGLVLRSQLMVLLRYGVFSDARGRYLDPPQDAAALERWLVAEMAARQVPHRSSNKLVQAGRADAAHVVPRLVLREMRDHPLVRAAAENEPVTSQDSSVRLALGADAKRRLGSVLARLPSYKRLVVPESSPEAVPTQSSSQQSEHLAGSSASPARDSRPLTGLTPLPSMIMEEADARALLDAYAALQAQGAEGVTPKAEHARAATTSAEIAHATPTADHAHATPPRPSSLASPALERVVFQHHTAPDPPPSAFANGHAEAEALPRTPEPGELSRWLEPGSSGEARLGRLASEPGEGPAGGSPRRGIAPSTAFINLEPFMACAPLTVRTATPAAEVHRLFLALSLRHLPVVDRFGIVWGMITRKDLDRAAGRGWWRVADAPPTPELGSPLRSAVPGHETRVEGGHPPSWAPAWLRQPRWLVAASRDGLFASRRSGESFNEPLLDPENPRP
ncbi:hypothetical protein QBZ16_002683 [Prototheca wickerhamii]|uniref:Chloride channel protein n=1 Tax=Prototheca wickerhamii TaxID=3111 RepID=A0AAD9MM12_PROWI|nr:hypothetical protein QBZ16_002683 [Prototheca wickerhamii]